MSNLKSDSEVNRLVNEVIRAPEFDKAHFDEFTSIERDEQTLDEYYDACGIFSKDDGWRKSSVKIRLLKEGVKYKSQDDVPELEVEGIWYRRLIEIIKSAYQDPTQESYHTIPFRLFHRRTPGPSDPLSSASRSSSSSETHSSATNLQEVFSNGKIPEDME